MTSDLSLRHATPADFPAIARLQTASWASAYAGLLDDSYITGRMAEDLAGFWARQTQGGVRFQIVAEAGDGRLLGFIALLPKPDGPYVDNLHVSPDAKGGGVGRALMARAARELLDLGENSLYLTVIDANTAAIAFYEAMGGAASGPFPDAVFDQPVQAYRYDWTDLPALAAKAG
ncbi:GNAT family N-acetyltransferase [Pseudoruegeria sp. SHC-113]|uniref:GNAT family N-acetyltransferase n=1 Tax=Pseudoruegeria sp. SHC-113 TaxID=2855439 RepID=UPI0021BA7E43|nr:GNAT family N-acetyltransferase [Pseudoruegeria sp. SHC-113]MCT8158774.1 GNAT family N-acetyltransferase [Pseudoruegeria sp. SHC-113]